MYDGACLPIWLCGPGFPTRQKWLDGQMNPSPTDAAALFFFNGIAIFLDDERREQVRTTLRLLRRSASHQYQSWRASRLLVSPKDAQATNQPTQRINPPS
jgi:hypothetical protein